ncbi:class C sortase [Microbacterium sp. SSW1-49]|uniref:Class C sortase n=1 Tax=Microbacterium croceum TaxID=2851645 RepID=A0ABT0FAM0_9MICO|nr:class C sortase [Microbacterium croceum]MCK2035113.1 class C sortase [Microbacterium croceum]
MTTTDAGVATPARRAERRWSRANIVVGLVVVAGTCLVAYPSAGAWVTDLTHASTVSGYAQEVAATDADELDDILAAARQYNADLPDGPLRDPYVLNAEGGADDTRDQHSDYLAQLSLRPDAPMARIRVPEIDVDLPVYHGTDESTLAKGIGHLYGSALPVGGAGTHAVLTGHSGIPGETLFTRLGEVEIGDAVVVEVAGEKLTYLVDQIKTVLPDVGDDLRQVAGHDYLTLLTCTPIGVNTHRLLVRAERVESTSDDAAQIALPASATSPAFPWDAALMLIGGFAIAFAIARPRAVSS